MTNKIFVHYLQSGEVVRITTEGESELQKRKDRGEPVLETDTFVDYQFLKVDMDTMKVVHKSPEELEAAGIVIPDMRPIWERQQN